MQTAKTITLIILTALTTFAIGLFDLPWYSFAITAFLIFIAIPQPAGKSFLIGFLTVFVLWALIALKLDFANEHILSKKVAYILPLKGNYFILILITALVGGLVAGFAAMSGSLFRHIFSKKRRH